MTPTEQRIRDLFSASLQAKQAALPALITPIALAVQAMANSLTAGGKILACGNGGSAADAQHFSAELLNRFERERAPLAALSLSTDTSTITSIANDYAYRLVFAKQVEALAKPDDILLAISTSGNSENVLMAVQTMIAKGGGVVALTGNQGGKIASALSAASRAILINVAATSTARIQEMHIMIIHALCDGIDERLYPA